MLASLSSHLSRRANGRAILTLLVGFVVFEFITLPILRRFPGGNIEPLDARFFYTPDEAFSTIASYADVRSIWIGVYLTWDIVNPILYTLLFVLLISWIFQRGFAPASKIHRWNMLPFGAGLFDLLENASMVTMLAIFPSQPSLLAWLATAFTMSKVAVLGISALLVLLGAIRAVANRVVRPGS